MTILKLCFGEFNDGQRNRKTKNKYYNHRRKIDGFLNDGGRAFQKKT